MLRGCPGVSDPGGLNYIAVAAQVCEVGRVEYSLHRPVPLREILLFRLAFDPARAKSDEIRELAKEGAEVKDRETLISSPARGTAAMQDPKTPVEQAPMRGLVTHDPAF
jgi:hypothetical protein